MKLYSRISSRFFFRSSTGTLPAHTKRTMLCSILVKAGNQAISRSLINSSTLIGKSVSESSQIRQIKRCFQSSSINYTNVSNSNKKMALPKVFFDVTANGTPLGRIEMEVSIF